jgi:hypothetical protein
MAASGTGGMQAELAAMATAVPQVDIAYQALVQAQGAVGTAMTSVGLGQWSSDGATVFRQVMEDFQKEYGKIANDLLAIHDALQGNTTAYNASVDAERTAVNQFNGLL